MTHPITPKKTTLLRTATNSPPGRSLPSSRELRLPNSSGGVVGATPLIRLRSGWRLLQERNVLAGVDPRVEDLLVRSVGLDLGDRLVHAANQRVVELKYERHVIRLGRRAELADDRALGLLGVEVLELRIAHVER